MPNRRSFKSDESFLEKLAMGAVGARAVFENLKRQGHRPIELERGSMSYKIWKKIKIKQLRVPDILCLNCGKRFESRAKTKLEISMSHSLSDPERGWDNGLANEDLVAFLSCSKSGERPIDWQASEPIQFITVGALREAYKKELAVLKKPKGEQEGFEVRVTWPSVIASSDGVVSEVSPLRLQFLRHTDSRTISIRLERGTIKLQPLVQTGDHIRVGQIIASVVPVSTAIPCVIPCVTTSAESKFEPMLTSLSVTDRYTAVKALSHIQSSNVLQALRARINDDREHIYVRLEAAAGLARAGQNDGMEFIRRTLLDDYLEHRLEAVIILGEICAPESVKTLTSVLLDKSQHAEIRAGAAWALGELQQSASVDALIQVFLELTEPIRIEAARALRKIVAATSADIKNVFTNGQDDQRAGIAWALSRSGRVKVQDLLPLMVDDDARRWVAYILGMQNKDALVGQIEELSKHDPEVYFAVTVLWKILASWVYNLEEF
ncbi:HEAT repeat domain-containing protein [Synechococcus sp. H60.4]|uniref:HEAT repeat domain-containing protein n=2 Tax=Synechococcus TaxID=1129 RepID=UPI0039C17645